MRNKPMPTTEADDDEPDDEEDYGVPGAEVECPMRLAEISRTTWDQLDRQFAGRDNFSGFETYDKTGTSGLHDSCVKFVNDGALCDVSDARDESGGVWKRVRICKPDLEERFADIGDQVAVLPDGGCEGFMAHYRGLGLSSTVFYDGSQPDGFVGLVFGIDTAQPILQRLSEAGYLEAGLCERLVAAIQAQEGVLTRREFSGHQGARGEADACLVMVYEATVVWPEAQAGQRVRWLQVQGLYSLAIWQASDRAGHAPASSGYAPESSQWECVNVSRDGLPVTLRCIRATPCHADARAARVIRISRCALGSLPLCLPYPRSRFARAGRPSCARWPSHSGALMPSCRSPWAPRGRPPLGPPPRPTT